MQCWSFSAWQTLSPLQNECFSSKRSLGVWGKVSTSRARAGSELRIMWQRLLKFFC